jgi:hypothetical protein
MLPYINKVRSCLQLMILVTLLLSTCFVGAQHYPEQILVKRTGDFEISGDGKSQAWKTAVWIVLPITQGDDSRQTKVKVLYSNTGIYFLFHNEDAFLTASKTTDFERLWLEDVAEVFLWPDTTQTIYFEYEISPLNYELPILIPNLNGKFLGWRPWEYNGERKTKHLTSIEGGERKTGSKIIAWYAEFFIPYKLMDPLNNISPRKGTIWKANLYRVDYDNNKTIEWSWKKTETTFHEFKKFGKMIFE